MSDEVDQLLEAFLQEAMPKIERLVTRALRDGRSVSELAIDLERGIDEKIRGGCAPRLAVATRWRDYPGLTEAKRIELSELILDTPPADVPVAIAIVTKRVTIVGVKRLEGDVIVPAKTN